METLRAQHDRAQAGDSTFSWELLTKVDAQKRFTLGSTGRFYHAEYGLLLARYVQFRFIQETEEFGAPMGVVDGEYWVATNNPNRSQPEQIIGLCGAYVLPFEDSFGWVIVNGPNIQSILYQGETEPGLFTRFAWNALGTLVSDTEVSGRAFASLLGTPIATDDPEIWELPPGSVFIRDESRTQKQIHAWIDAVEQALSEQILSLEQRTSSIESTLTAISTRMDTAESGITALNGRFDLELNNLGQSVAGVNRRIDALTGESGVFYDFQGLQNQLNNFITPAEARLGAIESSLALFQTDLSGLLTAQRFVDEQVDGMQKVFAKLALRLDTLDASAATKTDKVTSSTDNAVVRFDGTTGGQQDSLVTIGDTGTVTIPDDIVFSANNNYIYMTTTGGLSRMFGVNSGNALFIGGVDFPLASIVFKVDTAINLMTLSTGLVNIIGTLQCDALRIDQAPVALGAFTATHTATLSLNGTTYRFPVAV